MTKSSLAILAFIVSIGNHAVAATNLPSASPLLPGDRDWPVRATWQFQTVGNRNFYFAEMGNYIRGNPEAEAPYRQTGLLDRFIPGHWDLDVFTPGGAANLNPAQRALVAPLVEQWLTNRWPLHTNIYHVDHGKPLPPAAAIQRMDELWIGDDHPEAMPYRLDIVFDFLHEDKVWTEGSSFFPDMHEPMKKFFHETLLPRLQKELPFCRDKKHVWTHAELRRLWDIYSEEFFKPVSRPVVWTSFSSRAHLVSLPEVRAVGSKSQDPFGNAVVRGLNRQSGGGKLLFQWLGHEPIEKYGFTPRGGFYNEPQRDEWGYPLPHVWYYLFRPYLTGANYFMVEAVPGFLIQDLEGDGQWSLSTLGHIATDLLDYADRHPDRGVPYAPVALLLDYNRETPLTFHPGKTFYQRLPFDAADHMNYDLLNNVLFPEHHATRYTSGYTLVAPHGEIFDLLQPNAPGRPVSPAIFNGYKILFALGGLATDAGFASALETYVRNGGTLVLNVADLGEHLRPELFGVQLRDGRRQGQRVRCEVDKRELTENAFTYRDLRLKGARALYTCDGRPLVTLRQAGKGRAILVAAEHLLQNDFIESHEGRAGQPWQKRPLLKLADDLIERLTVNVTPFEVRRPDGARPDFTWHINRKGDGWTVTVFNYSLERETVTTPAGTAKVVDTYPYRATPFEIVCRAPMTDVMECYEDRDAQHEIVNGQIVVRESLRGGEIRVYEFQPRRIELPARTRPVNYALNKPVTASSTLKGHAPAAAVDGRRDNTDFWQSDLDPKRRYVFEMPQWLQVDLGQPRTIDQVFVQFQCWPHGTPETRQYINKYIVEASTDGQQWTTVLDESKNESPATPHGLRRWFKPVAARYVRLTVLRNSAHAGARVVELQVFGADKETYQPQRRSNIPPWQPQFPAEIANAPANRQTLLIQLKPKSVVPGWLPPGKTWEQMNGWVRLLADHSGDGLACVNSLYGESVSELVYEIPKGSAKFVAAAGLGCRERDASVVFRVFVDGAEKFNSGFYRFGAPVLPVVVDVKNAKELKLVVEDGGDGIINDYAWWGDARFIR